jgi:quinol monooxygenase YgiN
MPGRYSLLLASIAGVATVGIGLTALHAQAPSKPADGASMPDGIAAGQERYVQIAEIEIDPAQLPDYRAAVAEHAETAIRAEPGVLVLYAVSERDDPTRIKVFEIYATEAAYRAHLEAPHFKKYKAVTDKMVKSLKLIRTVPIALAAKER